MKKPFVIGITGGSGSGKTYFLRHLADGFGADEICLVSQDHYYRPRDLQPLDENGVRNFDLPASIDQAALETDLRQLLSGKEVTRMEYTFNNPTAVPTQLVFRPAPVILVEGLFVQYFPEIRQLLNLKVFMEAKDHVKLSRRIRRDNTERGYDLDDVLYRYQHHVMPVFEALIEPLRHEADLVVPNNAHIERAAAVVAGYIRTLTGA